MVNKDLPLGTRVTLSEDSHWLDGGYDEHNPTDCSGTVTSFDEWWVEVLWDNGISNSYKGNDSDLKELEIM